MTQGLPRLGASSVKGIWHREEVTPNTPDSSALIPLRGMALRFIRGYITDRPTDSGGTASPSPESLQFNGDHRLSPESGRTIQM